MSRDAESVEQAVTSLFDRQLCLDAVAGSGKTYMLTRRFLAAVTCGEAEIPQILALTFTDKAAAEMKQRIIAAFRESGDRQRAQAAYDATISTIHSFCARLLREYALEAGLPPGFQVLDELEARLLFDECWNVAAATADFLPLEDGEPWRNLTADRVRQAIWRVYADARTRGWTSQHLQGIVAAEPDEALSRWIAQTEAAVREWEPRCVTLAEALAECSLAPASKRELKIETLRAQLVAALRRIPDSSPPYDAVRQVVEVGAAFEGELKSPPKTVPQSALEEARRLMAEQGRPLLEALAIVAALDPEAEKAWWAQGKAFAAAALKVWQTYEDAKRQQALLDFDDLQVRVLSLLDDAAVRAAVRSRYRLVLVDEFQDTNILQVEILNRLAPPERIFTVGDAWQSIYAFRDADVRVYRDYLACLLYTSPSPRD